MVVRRTPAPPFELDLSAVDRFTPLAAAVKTSRVRPGHAVPWLALPLGQDACLIARQFLLTRIAPGITVRD